MLEILVHLPLAKGKLPDAYNLIKVEISEDSSKRSLHPPVGDSWRRDATRTRRIGDTWLRSKETALARVPSVILPRTWNWLLNPEHPDAKHARIEEVVRERFDNRLFRFGRP